MKKILIKFFATILFLTGISFCLTACDMLHTHSFTDKVVKPTCTERGYTEHVCSCGYKYKDNYVLRLGHSFTNYTYNNDAKCGIDGTESATCSRGCGETSTRKATGTALSHKFTNYTYNNDATCKSDGTKTATCDKGCGAKDTITVAGTKLLHSFTKQVATNEYKVASQTGVQTVNKIDFSDMEVGEVNTEVLVDDDLFSNFSKQASGGSLSIGTDGIDTFARIYSTGTSGKYAGSKSQFGYNLPVGEYLVTISLRIPEGFTLQEGKDVVVRLRRSSNGTNKDTSLMALYNQAKEDANGFRIISFTVTTTFETDYAWIYYYANQTYIDIKEFSISKVTTCQGTYFYSCECGEKGEETFTKQLDRHNFTYLQNDNDTHSKVCSTCGYVGETGNCYGETMPTCKIQSLCLTCGEGYGKTIPHKFTNYVYNNDATDKKDGTKTATCDYGCGSKYTITAFGTRLVCDATFSDISVLGSFICEKDDAGNNTLETWDIGGTDLGISVNLSNGETLLLFGDTFSVEDNIASENWRSGVIGKTRDTDLSDNLQLESFWTSNGWSSTEYAESPLASLHNNTYETTKIYSGGIEINGTIYLFYFSRHGTTDRVDKNNYGGCIKSVDGGVTWVRVPDLTWVDHSTGSGINGTGLDATTLQKLVNLDINATSINATQKFNIDLSTHEGYHFTQIYPINGGDGYIYIFGRGGYRTSGLKLGRVRIENFESFSSYEYLVGYNGKTPIWSNEIDDAIFIVDEKLSNMSVAYNPYIDQWVMSYLDVDKVEIVVRYSASLYGEWSDKQTLLQNKLIGTQDTRNLYGAYLNEKWVDNKGNFYFVFSRWRGADMIYRSYVAKGLITKS